MSMISLDDPQALEQLKALLGSDKEVQITDGIVVRKMGKVEAAVAQNQQPRVPGRWAHLNITMSPDFDDELPDSFWFGDEK